MVYNNLCPSCNAERESGVDISHKTKRIKIYEHKATSDVIEVCVHEGECSITDIITCACGHRGFILSPEDQTGICTERNEDLVQISIDVSNNQDLAAYCPSCNQTHICDDCGAEVRKIHKIDTCEGERKVCTSCKNSYKYCRICGDVYTKLNDDLEAYICDHCAASVERCPNCGSLVKELIPFTDEITCCSNCTSLTPCFVCGDNVATIFSNEMHLCGAHYNEYKNLPTINGYHRTQAITFHSGKHELKDGDASYSRLYFGVENEVQLLIHKTKAPPDRLEFNKRLVAKYAKQFFPDIECKRDGSLHSDYYNRRYDNGVELVWQPQSWAFIKENADTYKDFFDNISSKLRPDMAAAGMHVHLNKNAFTSFHFLKFVNFFYSAEKAGLLRTISGRDFNGYARIRSSWDGTKRLKHGQEFTAKNTAIYDRISGKNSNHFRPERYDVINTTNQNTYEIRIFKGARTYQEFMSRLEFVHAVFTYTKNASKVTISVENFIKFVKQNAKEYPELIRYTTAYEGVN